MNLKEMKLIDSVICVLFYLESPDKQNHSVNLPGKQRNVNYLRAELQINVLDYTR